MSQPPGSGPYPPQGVPPQQPQQPPYGGGPYPGAAPQPPYGSAPTPQPPMYGQRPPAYGQQPPMYGQRPPNFAAQQPYGVPQGQPGPSPYGQAAPSWNQAGGVPPQPPKKKSRAALIVGVGAIVIVLMIVAGMAIYANQNNKVVTGGAPATASASSTGKATAGTQAGPTAKITAALTVTCSGSTIDSSMFTAKVPSGWSCMPVSSGVTISDKKFDTLVVMDLLSTADAVAACNELTSTATVTALADTQWGGKTAKTVEADNSGSKVHMRCVSVNDAVYYLMGIPVSGTYNDIVAGADALTSAWTWK